ncbi:hypothetical protein Barb6_01362 [Bacteroidales bacterium Barb6]|nr:hypothetical protein Barb6_01362 [Bacteroidales bacterium Barb6]
MPECRRRDVKTAVPAHAGDSAFFYPLFSLLISKKHGNANGKKVKSREQDALLTELIGYGGKRSRRCTIRSFRG